MQTRPRVTGKPSTPPAVQLDEHDQADRVDPPDKLALLDELRQRARSLEPQEVERQNRAKAARTRREMVQGWRFAILAGQHRVQIEHAHRPASTLLGRAGLIQELRRQVEAMASKPNAGLLGREGVWIHLGAKKTSS